MVIAYHLIVTCYGFWLPNDPRGSWSEVVRQWELQRFGAATKVTTRRSIAHHAHDHRQRLAAKAALIYPPVSINGQQARTAAQAVGRYSKRFACPIQAFAILPEHWHAVIPRHGDRPIEQVAEGLKACISLAWTTHRMHPMAPHVRPDTKRLPSPWARNCWKVYIDHPRHLGSAIRYVNNNPIKEGKRPQLWLFIQPR